MSLDTISRIAKAVRKIETGEVFDLRQFNITVVDAKILRGLNKILHRYGCTIQRHAKITTGVIIINHSQVMQIQKNGI